MTSWVAASPLVHVEFKCGEVLTEVTGSNMFKHSTLIGRTSYFGSWLWRREMAGSKLYKCSENCPHSTLPLIRKLLRRFRNCLQLPGKPGKRPHAIKDQKSNQVMISRNLLSKNMPKHVPKNIFYSYVRHL